jgi:MEMO1 family protein
LQGDDIMAVRKAILSGSWYPGEASACRGEIETYLEEATFAPDPGTRYSGGIVPHAGWYFSGGIACNVINCLKGDAPIDVFVVFGMHLHPGSPNYMMTDGAWETPLGDIEIDSVYAKTLSEQFPFSIETPHRHTRDNTIEVQLPFIKYLYPNARLVPIGVPPDVNSLEIGKAAVGIAKELDLKVRIIGSTDLTHYGSNYGFSPKGQGDSALNWVVQENDAAVIAAMEAMDPAGVIKQGLENHNACCAGAAATAISAVKEMGAKNARRVQYATSHDKSPGESFVGYVGMVFH